MRSLDVAFNVMIYYTSCVAGFLLLQHYPNHPSYTGQSEAKNDQY